VICHLCGCKLAESDDGLKSHMRRYHAVRHNQVKTRFRPKLEVVADWEGRHLQYITFPSKEVVQAPVKKKVAQHEESTCSVEHCAICFNAKLDRLLASSEEALNASRNAFSIYDDLPSDKL